MKHLKKQQQLQNQQQQQQQQRQQEQEEQQPPPPPPLPLPPAKHSQAQATNRLQLPLPDNQHALETKNVIQSHLCPHLFVFLISTQPTYYSRLFPRRRKNMISCGLKAHKSKQAECKQHSWSSESESYGIWTVSTKTTNTVTKNQTNHVTNPDSPQTKKIKQKDTKTQTIRDNFQQRLFTKRPFSSSGLLLWLLLSAPISLNHFWDIWSYVAHLKATGRGSWLVSSCVHTFGYS